MKKIRNACFRALRTPWTAVLAVFFILFLQVGRIQLHPDPRVVRYAEAQYWTRVVTSTSRGDILDANGIRMAVSDPVKSFFIDPETWIPGNAKKLKGLVSDSVIRRISASLPGRFAWVERKVEMARAKRIIALELPGLYPMEETMRTYPHGRLLSHVLGFCDIDDNGISGMEQYWNAELLSPTRVSVLARDAAGNILDLFGQARTSDSTAGGTVRLTVDSRLQLVVEDRLEEAVRAHEAAWGAAVMMNPRTGAILAMASRPAFSAEDRRSLLSEAARLNNAIGRCYEPGSTFKPIVASMALDLGLTTTGEKFHCPRSIRIANKSISDVHPKGFIQDLNGIITHSLNVGMAQIGIRFQKKTEYEYLKQLGFGLRSGIEISGEEAGLLSPPENWWGTTAANIAIGQGIGVTALQMAVGMSAIANGGRVMQPFIVSGVTDRSGKTVYTGRPFIRADAISKKVCQFMREAMRSVVENGTGRAALTNAASIAGKTGTAQVAENGRYVPGRFTSSFAGFWPYDNPKYVLVVVVGDPRKGHYGSEVAAPAFRLIAEDMASLGL